MTWTRLSDDFPDRPEVIGLSDTAFRAHVEALIWCNKHTTNGHVPRSGLRRILSADDPPAAAAELTTAGMWDDDDTEFRLDWSEQLDAEEVEAERDKWARQKRRQRLHGRGDHSLCDPKRCWHLLAHPEDVSTVDTTVDSTPLSTGSRPVPSRPDPTPREGRERDEGARSAGATRDPRRDEATTRVTGHAYELPDLPDCDANGNDLPIEYDLPCEACGLPPGNQRHRIDGHSYVESSAGYVCAVCRRVHDDLEDMDCPYCGTALTREQMARDDICPDCRERRELHTYDQKDAS